MLKNVLVVILVAVLSGCHTLDFGFHERFDPEKVRQLPDWYFKSNERFLTRVEYREMVRRKRLLEREAELKRKNACESKSKDSAQYQLCLSE